MKLKTLKDFERKQYANIVEDDIVIKYFDERELKAEAIRDVKAIDYESEGAFELKEYIMWKNNLTDEELKKRVKQYMGETK